MYFTVYKSHQKWFITGGNGWEMWACSMIILYIYGGNGDVGLQYDYIET